MKRHLVLHHARRCVLRWRQARACSAREAVRLLLLRQTSDKIRRRHRWTSEKTEWGKKQVTKEEETSGSPGVPWRK